MNKFDKQRFFARIKDVSKAGSGSQNLAIVIFEQIALRLLNFGTFAIVARYVAPADMGILGIAWTVFYFIETLGMRGLASVCVRYPTSNLKSQSTFFWISIGSGLAGLATMCLLGFAGTAYFSEGKFQLVAALLGLRSLFQSFGDAHRMVLLRNQRQRQLTAISLTASSLGTGAGVFLALSGYGIWALLWSQLLGALAASLFCWLPQRWRPLLQFDPAFAKDIALKGAPLMLNSFGQLSILSLRQVYVSASLGLQAMGEIAVAYRLPRVLKQSTASVLGRFAFPYFSARARTGVCSEVPFMLSLKITLPSAILGIAALFFLHEPLVVFVFGEQWRTAADLFVICAIGSIAGIFGNYFSTFLVAHDSYATTTLNLLYSIITLPLFFLFSSSSLELAIGSVVCGQIACSLHLFRFVKRHLSPTHK